MATITPLADALANGTYGLADIIKVLGLAGTLDDSGIVDNQSGHIEISISKGKALNFTLSLSDQLALELTGVSIDYDDLKAAVSEAESGAGSYSKLLALFSDTDYVADFSNLAKPVFYTYGLGGDDNIKLTDFSDQFFLDGGKDRIDMGGGDDKLALANLGFFGSGRSNVDGGSGFDTLLLGGFTKRLVIDLTKAVTFKQADGSFEVEFSNVESVLATGFGDRLLGTSAANSLSGAGGGDKITGRGGADSLSGGLDADQFIYLSSKDSNAARGTDTIRDFETGIDRLDLSALHPKTGNDKFSFIGNDAFGARAGQVRFEQHDELGTANDYTLVQASLDGGHKIDLEIKLTGLADLTKTDFAL